MSALRWWARWSLRLARGFRRGPSEVADQLVQAAHRIDPRGQPTEMRLTQNLNGVSTLHVDGVCTFTGLAAAARVAPALDADDPRSTAASIARWMRLRSDEEGRP